MSRRIGLDVEAAYVRRLEFNLDLCPPPLLCVRGGRLSVTGRSLALVPHLSVDLLPSSRRVSPYVMVGAGAGHIRQRYFNGGNVSTGWVESTRSSLTLALSYGGGVEFRIRDRLSAGGDVRTLHLLDDQATPARFITPAGRLDMMRIGARVSWHF